MLGSMRLRHGARAATAPIFRATGHQHSELRRDHIETLGDVFADHGHRTATARTHRLRFVFLAKVRQQQEQPREVSQN